MQLSKKVILADHNCQLTSAFGLSKKKKKKGSEPFNDFHPCQATSVNCPKRALTPTICDPHYLKKEQSDRQNKHCNAGIRIGYFGLALGGARSAVTSILLFSLHQAVWPGPQFTPDQCIDDYVDEQHGQSQQDLCFMG